MPIFEKSEILDLLEDISEALALFPSFPLISSERSHGNGAWRGLQEGRSSLAMPRISPRTSKITTSRN